MGKSQRVNVGTHRSKRNGRRKKIERWEILKISKEAKRTRTEERERDGTTKKDQKIRVERQFYVFERKYQKIT